MIEESWVDSQKITSTLMAMIFAPVWIVRTQLMIVVMLYLYTENCVSLSTKTHYTLVLLNLQN